MARVLPDMPRLRARDFESCIRRCETCHVGASNTDQSAPTYIYLDPLNNIPEPSRAGALQALDKAVNARNRMSKRIKFGFSSSEDALTWVVFNYLISRRQLGSLLQHLGIVAPGNMTVEPTVVLLWGVPLDSGDRADELQAALRRECLALNENKDSMSEPDVIIDCGPHGIVFVEVKYRSPNDTKPASYANWQKYQSAGRLAWRFEEVKATGCYELARYWCLIERVARDRKATLVNLGLPTLFEGEEGQRLSRFVRALDQSENRQFKKLTWAELLAPILPRAAGWFSDYCQAKPKLLG
jgi:Holliday junction resolvase-like predicted endonuclease